MTIKTATGAVIAGIFALSASADEVRVYNWSDYIDESLLEKFEAETGIDITYDVYDSNELL
ncbi:MAG: spermidine/putrescine ABC transporter substrate-binding protein PotF, partial [Pseudomonadota bacterium]